MSSVNKDAKGWRVLFVDQNGDRKQIRPGKGTNKATAEQIGLHVDALVGYRAGGSVSMPRQTALWLPDVGDTLHAKLAKAGLVDPRTPPEPVVDTVPESRKFTLRQFLQEHMEHGRTAKGNKAAPATVVKWKPTETFLNEVFPGKLLSDITAEDAYQFRVWLDKRRIKQKTAGRKGQPMTENAKRRHIATCKMFFNAAKRRGLVDVNPFESQVSGTQVNRSRDYFITLEDAAKLLNAAPDTQWKLLIALWRLAGLRKMEVFKLTWGDVLRDAGKLRVHSSKTAYVDGCDVRYVPTRDIGEYLEDAFQAALPAGKRSLPADAPIITRFSASNSNLDKPFRLIVTAAGLVPWPKLFQNLRASCETQWLKDGERADLVANWMGHSVTVQRKNYVQHTDDDVEAFNAKPAFKGGNTGGTVEPRNGTKSRKVATQVAHGTTSKNTTHQRFSTSNVGQASNPARVRTDQQISTSNASDSESGNTGGTLPSDFIGAFAEILADEQGFLPNEIARILNAAERAGAFRRTQVYE